MGKKLILIAGVVCGVLWAMGYGPSDLHRAAANLANTNANAISPSGDSSDWG